MLCGRGQKGPSLSNHGPPHFPGVGRGVKDGHTQPRAKLLGMPTAWEHRIQPNQPGNCEMASSSRQRPPAIFSAPPPCLVNVLASYSELAPAGMTSALLVWDSPGHRELDTGDSLPEETELRQHLPIPKVHKQLPPPRRPPRPFCLQVLVRPRCDPPLPAGSGCPTDALPFLHTADAQ